MPHTAEELLGEKIDNLTSRFDSLEKRLNPLVDAYDSVIFGRKFLAGLAVVIASIAAVGGGVMWLVNYIRHG